MKRLGIPPDLNSAQKSQLVQSSITKATPNDLWKIFDLYKIVAQFNRGNLTQEKDEITLEYVNEMLRLGTERGLILVLEEDDNLGVWLMF